MAWFEISVGIPAEAYKKDFQFEVIFVYPRVTRNLIKSVSSTEIRKRASVDA